jgi:hypothetical protein
MPAANERALDKARRLPADAIIFDLEDAVAPDAKDRAHPGAGRRRSGDTAARADDPLQRARHAVGAETSPRSAFRRSSGRDPDGWLVAYVDQGSTLLESGGPPQRCGSGR